MKNSIKYTYKTKEDAKFAAYYFWEMVSIANLKIRTYDDTECSIIKDEKGIKKFQIIYLKSNKKPYRIKRETLNNYIVSYHIGFNNDGTVFDEKCKNHRSNFYKIYENFIQYETTSSIEDIADFMIKFKNSYFVSVDINETVKN